MTRTLALVAVLLSGAMAGFFYAWVCSTMGGLDAADPRVAVAAMQAMNASVRNAVFAPVFFGTAPALALAALSARRDGATAAAIWFAAAAATYLVGGNALTLAVNVPINEALAAMPVPVDAAEARAIWSGYSPLWQVWNQLRALACGTAFAMTALGLSRLMPRSRSAVSG